MPLPASPLLRFAKFARRFAPFWLVWLAIAALPATREPLQMHLWGSSLTPRSNPPWREDVTPDPRFDSFALVKARPGDLNARLWRLEQMSRGLSAGFDERGEQNQHVYPFQQLLSEAQAIQSDFPREKWLQGLQVRVVVQHMDGLPAEKNAKMRGRLIPSRPDAEFLPGISDERALYLARRVQNAARAEPANAYYALAEARIWRENHHYAAMWRALKRASSGKVYEDYNLNSSRAILRAHDAVRPLLIEEKDALWSNLREAGAPVDDSWPEFLGHEAHLAQKRGDHRRAVEIGVMLGSIGDLMQRGTNTPATALGGKEWKRAAQELILRDYAPRSRTKPAPWARSFALYAAAHGRPDVAAQSRKWVTRDVEITRRFGTGTYSRSVPPARRDAFWWVEFWRNAGTLVGAHLIFCAAVWLLANLMLWRAVGTPSTTRGRTLPALIFALSGVGLAWWSWVQFDVISSARWKPGLDHFAFAVSSVMLLTFVGAPFLLGVWTAAATMRHHKSEFLKSSRIETELRLAPGQTILLKMGPTILCAAALVATLGFWLGWLGVVACGVTSLDPFGWLSASTLGAQPVEWLIAPVVYCLFLDFLGFLLWFTKWRYFAGKASRPLTHGGLRSWKESLGIYLVIGSAIYGGVGACGWPARAEAARAMETRMTRGELAP